LPKITENLLVGGNLTGENQQYKLYPEKQTIPLLSEDLFKNFCKRLFILFKN
jgi:hypothetical protein